jgi:hypothetical protein
MARSFLSVPLTPLLVIGVLCPSLIAQSGSQDNRKPSASRQKTTQENSGRSKGGSGLGNYTEPPPANKVPKHLMNIVLGRPTNNEVTIRVLFHHAAEAYVIYGTDPNKLVGKTNANRFNANEAHDYVLKELNANSRYHYQLVFREESRAEQASDIYTFHTQRSPGSSFVFSVTADSHLDENTSGEVYLRTLSNALFDQPDFHFELGDTFMTGKYVKPEFAEPQYLAQRYYLGSLCHSAPLFFVLGNHDGESGTRGSTLWATQMRKRLFPNPEPNNFYSGNSQVESDIALPQNYYEWKWGDAQFIVLDPFRYTVQRSRDGYNWPWTLGERQYQWLKASLEKRDAKYRFVFIHHLVGGSPTNNRGGVEVAGLWEWGGKNIAGLNEFASQRPGWEMPIHDLLVKHQVSAVFHGHDHLFIKQDLDGIVYQEVPQPGHARSGNTNTAREYGYLSGEIQSSSGYVRVRVEQEQARVDYVRTVLPGAESPSRRNGDVSFSYQLPARTHPH